MQGHRIQGKLALVARDIGGPALDGQTLQLPTLGRRGRFSPISLQLACVACGTGRLSWPDWTTDNSVAEGLNRSRNRDADVLGGEILFNPFKATFTTKPGLLHPAKGSRGIGNDTGV